MRIKVQILSDDGTPLIEHSFPMPGQYFYGNAKLFLEDGRQLIGFTFIPCWQKPQKTAAQPLPDSLDDSEID